MTQEQLRRKQLDGEAFNLSKLAFRQKLIIKKEHSQHGTVSGVP